MSRRSGPAGVMAVHKYLDTKHQMSYYKFLTYSSCSSGSHICDDFSAWNRAGVA